MSEKHRFVMLHKALSHASNTLLCLLVQPTSSSWQWRGQKDQDLSWLGSQTQAAVSWYGEELADQSVSPPRVPQTQIMSNNNNNNSNNNNNNIPWYSESLFSMYLPKFSHERRLAEEGALDGADPWWSRHGRTENGESSVSPATDTMVGRNQWDFFESIWIIYG